MSSHHHDHTDSEPHEHDRGLSHDLPTLLSRRRALGLFGGAGLAAALAACTTGSDSTSTASDTASTPSSSGSTSSEGGTPGVEEIPEETGGPFPGDGSNGVNVLTESGIVRSDITTSFGSGSAVAAGVPLTIRLRVLDVGNDAGGYEGAAVYVWHCDREGRYSLYSQGVESENYLRGVQEADADGWVTFTSIFPAAYQGRWPHVHFEVYPDLGSATSASSKLRTSQLALPEETSSEVYATDGYEASVQNLAGTSLDSDMVFSDGYSLQLAKITGSVDDGLTATLNVPV